MSRLLSAITITAAVLGLIGCQTVLDWGPSSESALPFGDAVAIGRIENLNSEPIDDPDDLLGHSWFSGNLHISHVESGNLASRIVTVRYFGHTWLSEEVSFRFHLRADRDGRYFICKPPGSGSGLNCDR